MSSGRFLGGLLIGGALGAIIGMLLAPRSGDETRELIRDEFDHQVNRSKDQLQQRTVAFREKALEKADHLKEKTQQLATDLEEAGRETWEKLRQSTKLKKAEDLSHPETL